MAEVMNMMAPFSASPSYQRAPRHPIYHDMRTHRDAAPASPAVCQPAPQCHYQTTTSSSQRAPQASDPVAPPSPQEDPNKPSLPSISNLLNAMQSVESKSASKVEASSPPVSQLAHPAASHPPVGVHDSGERAYYPYHPQAPHLYRSHQPLTPPMRTDSMNSDSIQSPSTISSGSSISGPSYGLGVTGVPVDIHHARVYSLPNSHTGKPQHQHPQPVVFTSPNFHPSQAPYIVSPVSAAAPQFYSPEVAYGSGLWQQRPLPTNFPPTMVATPVMHPGMMQQVAQWNPPYPAMHPMAYSPNTQERYKCPNCGKAFSRPSSLKIHSHSHTGEKPYKCAHRGCNKSFSVRSNMKRHERGCHIPDAKSPISDQ